MENNFGYKIISLDNARGPPLFPPPPLAQLSPSLTARDGLRFLNMHVEGNANHDSRDPCNILYLAAVMTGWS